MSVYTDTPYSSLWPQFPLRVRLLCWINTWQFWHALCMAGSAMNSSCSVALTPSLRDRCCDYSYFTDTWNWGFEKLRKLSVIHTAFQEGGWRRICREMLEDLLSLDFCAGVAVSSFFPSREQFEFLSPFRIWSPTESGTLGVCCSIFQPLRGLKGGFRVNGLPNYNVNKTALFTSRELGPHLSVVFLHPVIIQMMRDSS